MENKDKMLKMYCDAEHSVKGFSQAITELLEVVIKATEDNKGYIMKHYGFETSLLYRHDMILRKLRDVNWYNDMIVNRFMAIENSDYYGTEN